MKIQELFEDETPTLFAACKALNVEFKELAKKTDLTLVAGMGWPQITKDGAWYGGGLGAHRGKVDPDALVSLDLKRKAFLRALARKLEDFIAKGHTVRVAAKAERSNHNEEVKAGEALEKVMAAAQTGKPPGNVSYREPMPVLAWFVSAPPELLSTELLSVHIGAYSTDYQKRSRAIFYIRGDAKKISALAKKLNVIQKQHAWSAIDKEYKMSADFIKLHNTLLMWAMEHSIGLNKDNNVPAKDVPEMSSLTMGIKKNRIVPKDSIVVNLDDVTPLKAYV